MKWTNYWSGGMGTGGMGTTRKMIPISSMHMKEELKNTEKTLENEEYGDPNLRSSKKVEGYTLHAIDNIIGNIQDFIIGRINWKIKYRVVYTRNWFPEKKVNLTTNWLKEINGDSSEITVKAFFKQIKSALNKMLNQSDCRIHLSLKLN